MECHQAHEKAGRARGQGSEAEAWSAEKKKLCGVIPSKVLGSGWFSGRGVEVNTVGEDQDVNENSGTKALKF